MTQNSSIPLVTILMLSVLVLLAVSLVVVINGTAKDIDELPDASLFVYISDIDAAEAPVLKLYCDPEELDGGE